MKTVFFGGYNSSTDFGLILSAHTIGKAEPKIETVELPAGNGVIDYTEYFGDVFYKNRPLTFDFSTIRPTNEFPELFSQIQDTLHGRKMRISLSDDPTHYYIGRISVNEWKSNGRIGKLTIDVDAEPWKYKLNKTMRVFTVSGSANIVLTNSRKPAVPKITVDSSFSLTIEGSTYALTAGEYTDSRISLKQGNNPIALAGIGTISFEWQEGGL